MIYADASALMKLVRREAETRRLRAWLASRHDETVLTNVVGAVELQRAAARVSSGALTAARAILRAIDQTPITPAAALLAASVAPPTLRTLDALHLASAATTEGVTTLLCYDDRLLAGATAFGLVVSSPS